MQVVIHLQYRFRIHNFATILFSLFLTTQIGPEKNNQK